MGKLYIYNKYKLNNTSSTELINDAIRRYGMDSNEIFDDEIIVSKEGKPRLKNNRIYFSISHSKNIWVSYLSIYNCGIDIQYITENDWGKISKRFYKKSELEFVKERGKEGFFKLWVRKEALGKTLGKGFFSEMPELVHEDNTLLEEVNFRDKKYSFQNIYIGKHYEGVVCDECARSCIEKIKYEK